MGNIYRPKCEEVLGIRKIHDFNATLLLKFGWKVITDPKNIWVEVVSAKCLTKVIFLSHKKTINTSAMWKYIWTTGTSSNKGLSWILGNGERINFL